MRWMLVSILLLCALAFSSEASKKHRDYVPDEKTARSIAEVVLIGQYGEERVKAESPLLVDGSNKQYWIVQVSGGQNKPPMKGGGPAVWIDRYSGCLKIMERMK